MDSGLYSPITSASSSRSSSASSSGSSSPSRTPSPCKYVTSPPRASLSPPSGCPTPMPSRTPSPVQNCSPVPQESRRRSQSPKPSRKRSPSPVPRKHARKTHVSRRPSPSPRRPSPSPRRPSPVLHRRHSPRVYSPVPFRAGDYTPRRQFRANFYKRPIYQRRPYPPVRTHVHGGVRAVICIKDSGFTLTNGCVSYVLDDGRVSPSVVECVALMKVAKLIHTDDGTLHRLRRIKDGLAAHHPFRKIPLYQLDATIEKQCPQCESDRCHRHWAVQGMTKIGRRPVEPIPHVVSRFE